MNTVEPIRDPALLERIQKSLYEKTDKHWKRIYLLFMVGIFTGLRISDILSLRVMHVNKGDVIRLREQKTGKITRVKINKVLRRVFDEELDEMQPEEFLFTDCRPRGRKDQPISTRTAENDMKLIQEEFGIEFPFSCHSLRKTFGYWHYKTHGNLEALRIQFNHSSPEVTRRYIGIDSEERERMIEDLDFGFLPRKTRPAKKRTNQLNTILDIRLLDRTEQGKARARKAKLKARRIKRGE